MVLFITSLMFYHHGNLLLYASGEDYKAKIKIGKSKFRKDCVPKLFKKDESMFKLAKIERLPKMNFRYHLLKVDGVWYLMEVDRPIIITYFLPWFVYFIPHKSLSTYRG